MINLAAAAIVFLALHRLISGGKLRDRLVRVMGAKPYKAAFGLASIACLAWLWLAYVEARASAAGPIAISQTAGGLIWISLVQTLAVFLIIPGVLTANPASVGQEGQAARPDIVRGMLRISRHPFLWGIALFALGHLAILWDAASFVFFGVLVFVAITGTFSIDAKRRRSMGDDWDRFSTQTSNIPFAAIVKGRQELRIREIGWWRILAAVAVATGLGVAHPGLGSGSGETEAEPAAATAAMLLQVSDPQGRQAWQANAVHFLMVRRIV